MNGCVCGPPEPAVEGDQLLEGAALLELGVVEAADHDVGHVREAVRAEQVTGRVRRERRERVLALDHAVGQVVRAAAPSATGPRSDGADEHPAHVRVRAERRESASGGARRSPRASAGAAPPAARSGPGCPSRARRRAVRHVLLGAPSSSRVRPVASPIAWPTIDVLLVAAGDLGRPTRRSSERSTSSSSP